MGIEEKIRSGKIAACLECKRIFYTENPYHITTPPELNNLRTKDVKWYGYHPLCFMLKYGEENDLSVK